MTKTEAIDRIYALKRWNDKVLKQPEQRWIPCSERLPDRGDEVLITTVAGILYIALRNNNGDGWQTENYYLFENEVLAWMPLPKPYEKEKDDDES